MTLATMDIAHQVAALPWRRERDGSVLVLLVTSLQTHRWIVPKGWPVPGQHDFASAALEAREEAGVVGDTLSASIGTFMYEKRRPSGPVLVEVSVYPLEVREELSHWPECKRRQRAWFTLADAAALVQEPGLQELLLRLDLSVDLRAQ
jgi:8-oxo-dGTP pyrophosphatase MutT (NUDIX family)